MGRFQRQGALVAVALAASLSVADAQRPAAPPPGAVVDVQLLAFNDFHGSLEPPSGSNGRIAGMDAGGVEYLSTQLARLKAANPNTVIVSAGDNIGASPLLSGMFHDEPSIEALSQAGLQFSAVGNHELDEGWSELVRMQTGGCHPVDGCQDGTPFAGAAFEYLSANIQLDPRRVDPAALSSSHLQTEGGKVRTLFPASAVKELGGVRVGFIGLTLEGAARIVSPAGAKGLTFVHEATAANTAAAALRKQGVHAIVVLIHEGGIPTGNDYDGCEGVSGAIVQIAREMSNDIDVVVSGHTHRAYNCTFSGKLVTSAASLGRVITDIDLQIDRATGRVLSKRAHNVVVSRDVTKDPAETAIIEHYRPFAEKVGSRAVGSITASLVRGPDDAGESTLGDAVADGMLDAARAASVEAVVAFTNPGGIRNDLVHVGTGNAPGPVPYAQVFDALPFGNLVIAKTMSGDAIARWLEQQFDNPREGEAILLQVSAGFAYAFDRSRPKGRRVDRESIMIDGQPLVPARRYRVVTTDFVWGGGDGFSVATEGVDPIVIGIDFDVFTAYLMTHSPLSPAPLNRIHAR